MRLKLTSHAFGRDDLCAVEPEQEAAPCRKSGYDGTGPPPDQIRCRLTGSHYDGQFNDEGRCGNCVPCLVLAMMMHPLGSEAHAHAQAVLMAPPDAFGNLAL